MELSCPNLIFAIHRRFEEAIEKQSLTIQISEDKRKEYPTLKHNPQSRIVLPKLQKGIKR
jgi:hypothetical protein